MPVHRFLGSGFGSRNDNLVKRPDGSPVDGSGHVLLSFDLDLDSVYGRSGWNVGSSKSEVGCPKPVSGIKGQSCCSIGVVRGHRVSWIDPTYSTPRSGLTDDGSGVTVGGNRH